MFSPLSRLRERGGGEGQRIHEVNGMTMRTASSRQCGDERFLRVCPYSHLLPLFILGTSLRRGDRV
ncbi:protein of unknown function [Cupriavidus taiwanensis]|nr:hypothetical protein CBM2606_A90094 [Cupriavidus taiwanensis]SPA41562.1 protein of unknown function [Cupriavidus taiwanensis]